MFTAMPVITCKAGAWSDMFPSSCGLYGLSLVVRAVVVMEFRQDLPGFRVLILRQFIRRSIFSEPHSDSEVWQPRKRTRTSTFAPPIASLRDVRISCSPRSCEPKLPQTSGCWQEWLGWVKPGWNWVHFRHFSAMNGGIYYPAIYFLGGIFTNVPFRFQLSMLTCDDNPKWLAFFWHRVKRPERLRVVKCIQKVMSPFSFGMHSQAVAQVGMILDIGLWTMHAGNMTGLQRSGA